jgi:hypothetical protein
MRRLGNGTSIECSQGGDIEIVMPGEYLVKIVKCSDENWWYKDAIGRRYIVERCDSLVEELDYEIVEGRSYNNYDYGFIDGRDVEVIRAG